MSESQNIYEINAVSVLTGLNFTDIVSILRKHEIASYKLKMILEAVRKIVRSGAGERIDIFKLEEMVAEHSNVMDRSFISSALRSRWLDEELTCEEVVV